MESTPFWVAGSPATGDTPHRVVDPYTGHQVATTSFAGPTQVEQAVQAAAEVARTARALPAYVRAGALDHVSRRLAERAGEAADLITAENGKPIRWARNEVARAVSTFRWAAEEARRFSGELQRLDTDPGGVGRLALVRRVPRGPVLGITPFNFPLNLVAHKIAPALAVSTPIVIKPAPATPLSALLLGELLAETGLPAGMFSILPVPNERAGDLVRDPRLPVVSFTGSGPVGSALLASVPGKRVTLELGGNAAVLVCRDWREPADLDHAARRVATFGNYQAGQSCIAVQRVLVHAERYAELLPRIVGAVSRLRTGDPTDPETDVGPMISEDAAARVQAWVDEARAAGATVECGGTREGTSYAPTVLTGVPPTARIAAEEVFGPVLVVAPVDSDEAGFAAIDDSRYGLQAGVFTRDLRTAFAAHQALDVGGVIVGDVPSYRADQMPYGGVKDSGTGREGLRSAMEDYTEPRVTVLTGIAL